MAKRGRARILGRGTALAGLVWAASMLSACGSGTGACVGTGGAVDECLENYTEDECTQQNADGVNGSTWTYRGGDSCDDAGYSHKCSGGGYVRSASDC